MTYKTNKAVAALVKAGGRVSPAPTGKLVKKPFPRPTDAPRPINIPKPVRAKISVTQSTPEKPKITPKLANLAIKSLNPPHIY